VRHVTPRQLHLAQIAACWFLFYLAVSLSCPVRANAQFSPTFQHTPIVDGDDTHGVNNLYNGLYHGYLYGRWNQMGSNSDETTHHSVGQSRAQSIDPLCLDGSRIGVNNCTAQNASIVVVAIGFSNWTKEVCGDQFNNNSGTGYKNIQADPSGIWPTQFDPQNISCSPNGWSFANISGVSNSTVKFVDCAIIGAVAKYWVTDDVATAITNHPPNGLYTNCMNILYGLGLDPRQVQVVLYKDANSQEDGALSPLPLSSFNGCPNKPPLSTDADACWIVYYVSETARRIVHDKKRTNFPNSSPGYFPNTKLMFVHSRIYGGYADPNTYKLNPEPFAYEQGFAMKWLIQSQIDEMLLNTAYTMPAAGSLNYTGTPPQAPWIGWGPYLWAGQDGSNGTHTMYPAPCVNCEIPSLTWRQDFLANISGTGNCNDLGGECDFQSNDNTHPSYCGRQKVAKMLLHFYCGYSTVGPPEYVNHWFRQSGANCVTEPPHDNACSYGQGPD
jgi:hypothetical protein